MEIIPSISFKEEVPVVVENDSYQYYSEDGQILDLDEIFQKLDDYDKLYYLDIDGINSNRPQMDVIRELSLRKEVWGDTGARDEDGITDAYIAGVTRAVISTKTARDWGVFERASKMSDELIMCVDINEDIISPSEKIREMSVDEIIQAGLDLGIDTFVIADLSESGFDKGIVRKIPENNYQLYIGGVEEKGIKDINHPNIAGFILGLKEAIRYKTN